MPDQITRNRFLAGIGAAVAAALTSRGTATAQSTREAAPLDIIRQSEIQAVFDDIEAAQRKMLFLRRRLLSGAKIEPGKHGAYFEPMYDTLRTEAEDYCVWDDFISYSLRICTAESAVLFNRPGYARRVPIVEFANA